MHKLTATNSKVRATESKMRANGSNVLVTGSKVRAIASKACASASIVRATGTVAHLVSSVLVSRRGWKFLSGADGPQRFCAATEDEPELSASVDSDDCASDIRYLLQEAQTHNPKQGLQGVTSLCHSSVKLF